jgi:hypothetical protein
MPQLFDGDSLAAMRGVRRVFDPAERMNPGKVVPVHACREWAGVTNAGRSPGRSPTPDESPEELLTPGASPGKVREVR